MPKNKGKGGKNRRKGRKDDDGKRELHFKQDGQEYAQIARMLGNERIEAQCFDGQKRLCHIPGKLRKKVWMGVGDIILVGLRDYQNDKCDVLMKYTGEEARMLKAYGELPESAKIDPDADQEEGEMPVDFDAQPGSDASEESGESSSSE